METRLKTKLWISISCLLGSSCNFALATEHTDVNVQQLNVEHSDTRVLVRWKDGSIRAQTAGAKTYKHLPNLELISVPDGKSLKETMIEYQDNPSVAYVEPDYRVQHWALPNDPDLSLLWGLDNASDTDINAPQAWDITFGSSDVVVAVIDSGVDYNHPDLANNMWQNPNEIAGNGIDDDGNGYIDDIYGIDPANGDSDPLDDDGHGTHVAGTIAAEADNGLGVAGVAPNTQIIACKFLDQFGSGFTSDAIECLDYLYDLKVTHGINIVATNNSWGGGGYSLILEEAIRQHNDEGILFVAAAGNSGSNIDIFDSYPATYDIDNVISVAAIDEYDQLAYFSNYGVENVDIAAPGVGIYSTLPNNTYGYFDGTSMAAPHVTGAIALLAASEPDFSMAQYKELVVEYGQDVPSLASTINTGSRLVLWNENNSGPMNCEGHIKARILEPFGSSIRTYPGAQIDLFASVKMCAEPVTGASYDILLNNQIVGQLVDDGTGNDENANDGIYSSILTVNFIGEVQLSFSGGLDATFQLISAHDPVVESIAYDYQDIEGIELIASNRIDTASTLEPGFSVKWPMGNVDVLYVSSNGTIASQLFFQYFNESLPVNFPDHAIYPFWDDLQTANGGVYYEISGSAPNRQLIIEYRDVTHFALNYGDSFEENKMTFQVVMSESSPEIVVNYKDVEVDDSFLNNGGSATVGYQYFDAAVQLSHNQAIIESGTSYRYYVPADDYPEILSVAVSGLLRENYPVEIAYEYEVPEGAEDISLSVDLGNGDQQPLDLDASSFEYIYSQAGTYQVNLLLEADGLISSKIISVTIDELTELEQRLVDIARERAIGDIINTPEDYGLITQDDHEIALMEESDRAVNGVITSPGDYGLISQADSDAAVIAESARVLNAVLATPSDYDLIAQADSDAAVVAESERVLNAVLTDPESYGLFPQSDLQLITVDSITGLSEGKHLLGSSVTITDLDVVFSGTQLVWVYEDGNFLGWSPDESTQTKILNSGYGQLSEIKAGTGFWIKK